jgi:hypothetical protein
MDERTIVPILSKFRHFSMLLRFILKFTAENSNELSREHLVITPVVRRANYIARSNEILGWEGVGNRQLLCFFKA